MNIRYLFGKPLKGACAAILFGPALAFGALLEGQELDASLWRTFDWSAVEASTLWKSPLFKPYTNAPASEDLSYKKIARLPFGGRALVVTLAESRMRLQTPFRVTLTTDPSTRGDCELLRDKLNVAFGADSTPISWNHQLAPSIHHSGVVQQWIAGSTAIELRCESFGAPVAEPDDVYVTFQSKEAHVVVEPAIHLLCTRTYVMRSDPLRQPKPSPPLTISLIPATSVVLDANGVVVGKITGISSSSIQFTVPTRGTELEFSTSRVSGALTGTLRIATETEARATASGECVARDPSVRRF